jgi:hypothetical protein
LVSPSQLNPIDALLLETLAVQKLVGLETTLLVPTITLRVCDKAEVASPKHAMAVIRNFIRVAVSKLFDWNHCNLLVSQQMGYFLYRFQL